jgi:hypothetical protein
MAIARAFGALDLLQAALGHSAEMSSCFCVPRLARIWALPGNWQKSKLWQSLCNSSFQTEIAMGWKTEVLRCQNCRCQCQQSSAAARSARGATLQVSAKSPGRLATPRTGCPHSGSARRGAYGHRVGKSQTQAGTTRFPDATCGLSSAYVLGVGRRK